MAMVMGHLGLCEVYYDTQATSTAEWPSEDYDLLREIT